MSSSDTPGKSRAPRRALYRALAAGLITLALLALTAEILTAIALAEFITALLTILSYL